MSDSDEENRSCHSSSSDTLTCSVPEVNTSPGSMLHVCASLFHHSFTVSVRVIVPPPASLLSHAAVSKVSPLRDASHAHMHSVPVIEESTSFSL